MRRPQATTLRTMLGCALALALAGCASATSTTTPRAVKVAFKSPAVAAHTLPALYTCDGKNVNPPLEWGTIPGDTGELVIAAIGLTPASTTKSYTATIEWTIAGVNPQQHKLNPGETPPGTHVGLSPHNGRHYSLCPKKHQTTQYQFMLYGVPANDKVSPNFADQPILAGLSQPNSPITTTAEGAFLTHYTPR